MDLYDEISELEQPRIRLLTIEAGTSQDIACTLSTYGLDEVPSYEALSYVWGDATTRHVITCNGHELAITANLRLALGFLRHDSRPRTLWIDAICINQENLAERSTQVQLMADIYRGASSTIIWLGEADRGAHIVLGLCHNLMDPEQALDKIIRRPGLVEAILEFFGRPWFNRAWVIQELILSGQPIIMASQYSAPWRGIELIIDKLSDEATNPVAHGFSQDTRLVSAMYQLARSDNFVAAFALKNKRQNVNRDHHAGGLLDLLVEFRSSASTDPRDKVYSLLGLTNGFAMKPDYTLTVADCYVSAAFSILESTRSLRIFETLPILGRYRDMDLPSWVPQWNSVSKGYGPGEKFASTMESYGRFQADGNKTGYAASGGSRLDQLEWIKPNLLMLSGIVVDSIATVAGPLPFPVSVHNSLATESARSFFGAAHFAASTIPSAGQFASTLAAWRKLGIDDAPNAYPTGEDATRVFLATTNEPGADLDAAAAQLSAAQTAYERQWGGFLGKIGSALDVVSPATSNALLGLVSLTDMMRSSGNHAGVHLPQCYERRLARTAKGYLGLLPSVAQAGDSIALLAGGDVPFVLRPDGPHWRVVGGCYVHGIMSGQAWDETQTAAITLS